jgi:hypothetical protein
MVLWLATLGLSLATTAPAPESARTSEDEPGAWGAVLSVAHCPYAPPKLPAESETALDATLLVRVPDGTGSAFLISPDGFALTAAHVVGGHATVDVVAHGGARLKADVVRVNASQDVALLKVAMIGSSSCLGTLEGKAALGSDIFILGSPAGEELSFSVSKGIVSGYRNFAPLSFVQLDASVNPGNSGGPAVDVDGNVVGVASWKVSHVSMEGLAFAVPADVALTALGIEYAVESASNWTKLRGRITSDGEQPLAVSRPPPPVPEQVVAKTSFDPAQLRRDRLRKGLIVSGSIALGSGVITVAGTYAAYRTRDSMTSRRWNVVRGFNTTGWALSIAGAALLGTGLIVPKKIKKKRSGGELSLCVAPQGVLLLGAF